MEPHGQSPRYLHNITLLRQGLSAEALAQAGLPTEVNTQVGSLAEGDYTIYL